MPRPCARPGVALLSTVLTVCLLAASGAPAVADPTERRREVDAGIAQLEHALEGTSAELAAAAVALRLAESRLPAAQAELQAAQGVLAEARARDAELAGRLAAATLAEAKANDALDAGRAAIADTHRQIGRIASQAYRGGTLTPALAIALSAESPAQFADRYVIIDTALRGRNGALARLGEQQALRTNAEARLDAVRDEVDRLRREAAENVVLAQRAEADAAARKAEIDQLLARQRDAIAVIDARKADELARLDRLEAERAALEAELARIAADERRRAAASRGAPRAAAPAAPPASSGRGPLSRPVPGIVTSPYGYRIHPISGTRRLHAGTDFRAPCGSPVSAAADGSVVSAGRAGGYGNRIVVNHGAIGGRGVATSYNHLTSFAVTAGRVFRGQVIAYAGTTGASTGCHLHFEVYVDGSTVNPMGWL